MKQISKFFLCQFLLSISIFSQESWIWQNPLPQGNNLYDVQMVDQNFIIAVGDMSTIVKTHDGGISWDIQHGVGGTSVRLASVHFIDGNNGWAVGGYGYLQTAEDVILRTTNGGTTWTNEGMGRNVYWTSVFFIDPLTGWIGGNGSKLLKTIDGGNTWAPITIDSTSYLNVTALHFVNSDTGWAIVEKFDYGIYYAVYHTIDGGLTWSNSTGFWGSQFYSLYFPDASHGWAIGEGGFIQATNNGGNSWFTVDINISNNLYAIYFSDVQTGWIVGENGLILKTSNGGATWQIQTINISQDLHSVNFVDDQVGWAVGLNGVTMHTSNGGDSWIAPTSRYEDLNDVCFVDDQTGWAVGDPGMIIKTTDAGQNWVVQSSGTYPALLAVDFVDTLTGWTVGYDGTILKTNDGGAHWTEQNSGVFSRLTSIDFIDAQKGWIVGWDGVVLNTTDGGATWEQVYLGIQDRFWIVFFLDSQTGWISPPMLKTDDGGDTWTIIPNAPSALDIQFVDPLIGWALMGRRIYKSGTGGLTWFVAYTGEHELKSISYSDFNRAWAVGDNGLLLKTTNGGGSWQQDIVTAKYLNGVNATTSGLIWIVGEDGAILKGESEPVGFNARGKSNQIDEFSLLQNYPNPFNPITHIRYSLPKTVDVKIDVYDILGRHITTLVDTRRPAGFHTVDFDGSNLQSGIYFYRIKAGTFEHVRKMVVIK